MKSSLFTRVGWFYLPYSAAGSIFYIFAAGFCATVFLAVDRHSHSASDTFYGVFPYLGTTFLLLDWIARRLAETPNQLTDPTLASDTSRAGHQPHHR
jgi:hypothetical protein